MEADSESQGLVEDEDSVLDVPTVEDEEDPLLSKLFTMSWPLWAFTAQLLYFFLGHQSDLALEGVALGLMYTNVVGFCILYGLSNSLDTLASQAYGAGKYREMSLALQRVLVVVVSCAAPSYILFNSSEKILEAAGQATGPSEQAAIFVFYNQFGFPLWLMYENFKRYIAATGEVRVSIWSGAMANVAVLITMLFATQVYEFDFRWAPIANSFAALFACVTLYYVSSRNGYHSKVWTGWELTHVLTTHLDQLWVVFKLSFLGFLMIVGEWLTFEIMTIVAGWIGPEDSAAYVVTLQVCAIAFFGPLSVGITFSILTGNALGNGEVEKAKKLVKLSLYSTAGFGLFNALVILIFQGQIPRFFSNDIIIKDKIHGALPYVALCCVTDGAQAILGGIIRGLGLQKYGGWVSVGAYYLVGIPVGMLLCMKTDMEINGLWVGLFIAQILQITGYLVFIYRSDFEEEAEIAKNRTDSQGL